MDEEVSRASHCGQKDPATHRQVVGRRSHRGWEVVRDDGRVSTGCIGFTAARQRIPSLCLYRRLSTARGSGDLQRFRITHPFHPKKGQEYELVGFAHTWGEYRVFFRLPGDLRTQSVPADWTDVEEPDAFVTCSAQRSLFRPKDLLELADLLEVLEHQSVRTTTPNV